MDAEDRRLISDRLPIKKKDKLNHVMISLLRFLTGRVVYANKLSTLVTPAQLTTNNHYYRDIVICIQYAV